MMFWAIPRLCGASLANITYKYEFEPSCPSIHNVIGVIAEAVAIGFF
jgi:hypothetical protein